MLLGEGHYPVHDRWFSSIPGLYLLDANRSPTPTPVVTTKNIFGHCPNVPRGAKSPLVEKQCLRAITKRGEKLYIYEASGGDQIDTQKFSKRGQVTRIKATKNRRNKQKTIIRCQI